MNIQGTHYYPTKMNFNHMIIPKNIQQSLKSAKNIVVRFPPEPSGYLHLGHIKALYINTCIAKKFNGKLIIRFDDTNPTLESDEFEKAILDDLKSVGTDLSFTTYTSDYFDQLIIYAEQLINKGLAYVDFTEVETMRKMRETSTPSQYRQDSISDVMNKWNMMKSGIGNEEFGTGVLRLKTDLYHKNKAMRDPSIYRTIKMDHHRTGGQFCVYPTYDFACPVVDAIEGVTHVFRSAEYNERNDQADFILSHLDLKKPSFYHYGRISIKGAELSKRKIKQAILEGRYTGWDDVRLYTFRGLIKRGLLMTALEEFMKETGYSTAPVVIDPSKLWQINKKHIDALSSRYMVIDTKYRSFNVNPLSQKKTIPRYIKNMNLGNREIYYDNLILISDHFEEPICLINWGTKMSFSNIDGNLVNVDDVTNRYIPWVTKSHITVCTVNINGDQLNEQIFLGEEAMKEITVGEYVQLLQKGYYICSENKDNTIKLINIC